MPDDEDHPKPSAKKKNLDGPDPLGLDKYTDAFYYFAGFFFVAFGFFKVIVGSMAYPYGSLLDWGVLRSMAIGCFYAFCGLGILVVRPSFEWMAGTLFLILFLELMQVGGGY
ncbi:MAG TPA: hypothetical protein VL688_02330 [Verrucomicrobiae bacterium]|jgi:hypothetical protein|nr:hypothetical protein [Verrucomicrobiae bacterium]